MPEPEAPHPTTSAPPDFPEKQQALFRETLLSLNQAGAQYVVAGAFAMHFHTGIWRITKDLDVFLPAQEMPRALRRLEEEGMVCEVCDSVWLAKARRGDYFVDLITGMSNAVICVDSSWIDRGIPSTVLGVQTRMLAVEELLVSKLFIMRRERFDGADITHIIYATQGELDWDRILALTGEHWELLLGALVLFRYVYPAHSGLVPGRVWEQLLSKFTHGVANPDLDAPFRGSLVDDKMFAIDVAEWGLDDILSRRRAERTARVNAYDANPDASSSPL